MSEYGQKWAFSMRVRLEIFHQERRRQVKTIAMEHFNGILFHMSEPANKQHTNQSVGLMLIWSETASQKVPCDIYVLILSRNRFSNLIYIYIYIYICWWTVWPLGKFPIFKIPWMWTWLQTVPWMFNMTRNIMVILETTIAVNDAHLKCRS